MNDLRILGLAGSLRRASFHRGLVRAARELAPEGVAVEPYEKLAEIPFFNQDVEDEGDPAPVRELKEKIREVDTVLIATPEYDYAIPGVLTNALDWALRYPLSPAPLTGGHRRGQSGRVGNGAGPDGPPPDPLARPRLRNARTPDAHRLLT